MRGAQRTEWVDGKWKPPAVETFANIYQEKALLTEISRVLPAALVTTQCATSAWTSIAINSTLSGFAFANNLHFESAFSYGTVAFALVSIGLVFSVFAIFEQDSQIGRVWLAGPTAIVIGLVLCGKVSSQQGCLE